MRENGQGKYKELGLTFECLYVGGKIIGIVPDVDDGFEEVGLL